MVSTSDTNLEARRSMDTILTVDFDLDCPCAKAIAAKVGQSLRNGCDQLLVDLTKSKYLSLFGLSVLIYRLASTGDLERVNFQTSGEHISQLLLRF